MSRRRTAKKAQSASRARGPGGAGGFSPGSTILVTLGNGDSITIDPATSDWSETYQYPDPGDFDIVATLNYGAGTVDDSQSVTVIPHTTLLTVTSVGDIANLFWGLPIVKEGEAVVTQSFVFNFTT